MIVMKFGGSSVDAPESIERVVGIVRSQLHRRPVVVVSAMAKTTRRLLRCADAAAAGDLDLPKAHSILNELREYHHQVAHAVVEPAGHSVLEAMLDRYLGDLTSQINAIGRDGRLSAQAADAVASYGELLSSAISSLALDRPGDGLEAPWIDCRQVLVTDDSFNRAKPIYEETEPRMRRAFLPHLEAGRVPVVGGYVGATRDGITTTLGREGSDFTAAIVGAALGAEEVQIWTDVDGMMTADPRLVPGARRIRTLSFGEGLELACSGAKKPHWGTLGPARRANVPIRILNSWNPHLERGIGEGTLIGRRNPAAPPGIKSICWRANARLLTVRGDGPGFQAAVFAICERYRPSLQVLGVRAEGIELALDLEDRLFEIRGALSAAGDVQVGAGRAVVSLVSDDLAAHPELVEQTLAEIRALDAASEPRLVLTGSAAPCLRCLTSEESAPDAVTLLHEKIFHLHPEEPVG
ncbi:MAG TPA: lysine-sensitive aspartokinase 3 [Acidobacteria bacterium]|nr:lysine-sensitive aspartokinase 3 [Acidobacteriota bacterium]